MNNEFDDLMQLDTSSYNDVIRDYVDKSLEWRKVILEERQKAEEAKHNYEVDEAIRETLARTLELHKNLVQIERNTVARLRRDVIIWKLVSIVMILMAVIYLIFVLSYA